MYDEIFGMFRGWLAFCGGVLSYVYGELNGLLVALLVCIVIDYITGLLKGAILKKLSSDVGFKGILKKVFILMIVGLAHVIDNCVGSGETWRNIVIVFYICNEGLSIIENSVACGLPVPEKLKDVLLQMRHADLSKDIPQIQGGADNGSKNNI